MWKIIKVILILFIIAEFSLNFNKKIKNQREYKKTHCMVDDYIFLCSNISGYFLREDHQLWKLSTNSFGERITTRTISKENQEEIWFIGDSISFGYLVNDENSIPYLLDQSLSIPVRNLGIDSLGTKGILQRLKKGLEDHPETQIQTLIWVYNTSDFYDDIKELQIQSHTLKSNLFTIHFYLSRHSNIYNSLLYLRNQYRQKKVPEAENITPEIANYTHITFENIKKLIKFIKENQRIKRFLVVIYPGMNIKTKKADLDSKLTQLVYEFFKNHSVEVIDIRKFFIEENYYFIFDGHPSEKGYQLIMSHLIDHLKQK